MRYEGDCCTDAQSTSRRGVLIGRIAAASALAMLSMPIAAEEKDTSPFAPTIKEVHTMSRITTKDGVEIYYKDWGIGRPVIFSHGWPLNADAWDDQMFFLASHDFRCIAFDRRGFGRSSQPWDGNDYDTYADDLATLIKSLDLKGTAMVGHSAGAGDIVRYIGRHGTRRVSKAVLASSIPPLMVKTPAKMLMDSRLTFLTASGRRFSAIARNSTGTSADRSMARTGPGLRCHRVLRMLSGSGRCKPDCEARMKASGHSRRRTSRQTSKSSMFQP